MKEPRFYLMLAAFVVFLASCSTVAHIEKDETADFDKYKTFTWAESGENDQVLNDIQASNLQAAVSEQLKKANWKEEKNAPDVILKHDVQVEKTIRENREAVYSQSFTRTYYNPYTRRWVNIYYPSRFLGYDHNQYQANEGTITISMIDAKTNKVVWQGWTTGDVNRKISSKDLQSGVKTIFKKFDLEK